MSTNILERFKEQRKELRILKDGTVTTIYSNNKLASGNVGAGTTFRATLTLNGIAFPNTDVAENLPFLNIIPALNAKFAALKAVFSVAPSGYIRVVITSKETNYKLTTQTV